MQPSMLCQKIKQPKDFHPQAAQKIGYISPPLEKLDYVKLFI